MTRYLLPYLSLLLSLALQGVYAPPPCGGSRGQPLCALYITPYSDNAYEWQNICEFSASPDALIADNIERYDEGFPCSGGYTATCCASLGGCGNGIDCDVQTSLPPPITDPELPSGWSTTYACAVDNASRVITGNLIVEYVQSNTPYACTSFCASKGYPFAGVEYGDECYCGTALVSGIESAPIGDCDMRCPGNYNFLCGGSWSIQIYQN